MTSSNRSSSPLDHSFCVPYLINILRCKDDHIPRYVSFNVASTMVGSCFEVAASGEKDPLGCSKDLEIYSGNMVKMFTFEIF